VIEEAPEQIDTEFLNRFEKFRQFRALRRISSTEETRLEVVEEPQATPEEAMGLAYE